MKLGLLIPVVMLAMVLLMAPLAWRMDKRQQRLQQRVAALGVPSSSESGVMRDIRLDTSQESRRENFFLRMLRVPVGMPNAHVVPAWLVVLVAIVAGVAGYFLAHLYLPLPAAGAIGVLTVILVARGIFSWETERYQSRLLGQIPDVIDMVVGAVRVGLPVSDAFRAVAREMPAPTSAEFTQIVSEITVGMAPAEALMQLHRRTNVSEYAIFSVTLAIQARSGGRLAEMIENLADTVRQRAAIKARANALAAEAKLSANILTILPVIGGAVMSFLQPGFLNPLFHEPKGQRLLAVGISLLILGTIAMRRMIKGVTRE